MNRDFFLKERVENTRASNKYDVSFILICKKLKIDLMTVYVVSKINLTYMMN